MQASKLFNRLGFKLAACTAGLYCVSQTSINASNTHDNSIELLADDGSNIKSAVHKIFGAWSLVGISPLCLTAIYKPKSKPLLISSTLFASMFAYALVKASNVSSAVLTRACLHPDTMTVDMYRGLPVFGKGGMTSVPVRSLSVYEVGAKVRADADSRERAREICERFVKEEVSGITFTIQVNNSLDGNPGYILASEDYMQTWFKLKYQNKELISAVISGDEGKVAQLTKSANK